MAECGVAVPPVSIVIPTYRREQVLLDTLDALETLAPRAAEVLVMDQTAAHEPAVAAELARRDRAGEIRWIRLDQPSITAAMNQGLLMACQQIVLFLDDDVVPAPGLVQAHWQAQRAHGPCVVAGRVLQPWNTDTPSVPGEPFHFASTLPCEAVEFIGANFSVDRRTALDLGGFDENFVRVAYRYEAEFAHRLRASGGSVWFEPAASLRHLKAGAGGTRSFGNHLDTIRPDHAVGAYYFALRTRRWRDLLVRPVRSVLTRFHLRRPWFIPVTLIAEVRGILWAIRLHATGPRRLRPGATAGNHPGGGHV